MNTVKHFIFAFWIVLALSGCATANNKVDKNNSKNEMSQLPPKLTKPVARKIWVEPEITENGTVYIEGHWKYLLLKDSQWTK